MSCLRIACALALATLTGCVPAIIFGGFLTATRQYSPGALPAQGGRRLGCLEVGARAVDDATAAPASAVFDVTFGNACDHAINLDARQLRATARYGTGPDVALTVLDPRREITVTSLRRTERGEERLEFDPPVPMPSPPDRVCLVVDAIGPGQPVGQVAPMCFERHRGWALAAPSRSAP